MVPTPDLQPGDMRIHGMSLAPNGPQTIASLASSVKRLESVGHVVRLMQSS